MLAAREVQRELLDELPADDTRAVRSRRDLIRVNAWMLQAGIMARALLTGSPDKTPRTILDLGAGDGTFMLRVAQMLAPKWKSVTVALLDQSDIVSIATRDGFSALGWTAEPITGDMFALIKENRLPGFDAVTANLFLHHFDPPQLERLLAQISPLTSLFVACEPRRAAFPLLASHLLWVIGCNEVTRHDAVISVRAGFNGDELSASWPDHDRWELDERAARLFTHCFIARRKSEADARLRDANIRVD